MLLFLDANILFSAALTPGGRAHGLVELGHARRCRLITSGWAIREVSRNLAVKASHAVDRLQPILSVVTTVPEPPEALVRRAIQQSLPEKDARILAAAVAAGASHLVTGDRRHFDHLLGRTALGVQVIRLADAFELVLAVLGEGASGANGTPS